MDQFWEEFESGEIHFRDRWQFELKSEFSPLPNRSKSEVTQEFYIFIPNSLQMDPSTYFKEDFYHDQTSLIRFKTPVISFAELIDNANDHSPLIKLKELGKKNSKDLTPATVERELKLYASVFRSSLRRQLYPIMLCLESADSEKKFQMCTTDLEGFLSDIEAVRAEYANIKKIYLHRQDWKALQYMFEYIDDSISISLNSSMSGLLKVIRSKHSADFHRLETRITSLLLEEKKYREERLNEPSKIDKNVEQNEAVLYQSGLLNKYVMDVLQLKTERKAVLDKFRSLIGSLAAGIAMLLYISLFIWHGTYFVINSLPFVLFMVFIYILKDRLKEELKNISYKQVFRWYPDYTTAILSPNGTDVIGKMHDSFAFIPSSRVPNEIWQVRNEAFHSHLEMIKRQEKVIYYKKQIIINSHEQANSDGLSSLNIIFRHDIHKFMAKASDPFESYTTIDSETQDLITTWLPKVYHINIILKNSYLDQDLKTIVELKKFRLIVDKNGIKRIESVVGHPV